MMPLWTDLLRVLDDAAADPPRTVERVADLMHRATPHALAHACDPDRELPWGRYLVHADPAGRYNLQLDVFSRGYTGQIHAHGTWGIFWLLQGALVVTDCEVVDNAAQVQRVARLGRGGSQCFCPPASDWHRVATPEDGPQTVSLHLYGPGFDLDTGVFFGDRGPTSYRRGPFGDLARVTPALSPMSLRPGERSA